MDKIKKLIIICTIFIIIIVIIIGVLNIIKNKQQEEEKDEFGEYKEVHTLEEPTPDTSIKKVNEKTKYYIVKNIIDEYFEYINMINMDPSTELEKEDSDFAISSLTNMYNDSYMNEFNITTDNLAEKLEKYIGCEYNIDQIYGLEKSTAINVYMVYVNIQNIEEDINFIIATDSANSAFEIYGDEYAKKYKLEDINIEKLKQNSFNKIESIRVTNEDIAINYFNNYKYKMLNNIEESYNMLDEEYRKKRFGNIDEYKKYISENIESIREIVPKQYLYNQYENYTEYVCRDQYENLYIFDEKAIMDYTVKLDTYTIITDKFKEEYANGNNNKKVIMNMDKFIQMINNKDFKSAYQVLNNTFKENNFGSEEAFKQYMKNTYYNYNNIVINDFSSENNTYICKTTITNKENEEETKDMNIIMRLNQGTDFEMSFEII